MFKCDECKTWFWGKYRIYVIATKERLCSLSCAMGCEIPNESIPKKVPKFILWLLRKDK